MRKSVWLFMTAITLSTGILAVACGDDDDNPAGPGVDGGRDTGPNNLPDTGPPGPGPDGGDGGCTFAGFVINLVNTQTSATALPSADLGDRCTPSNSQDDFKSLFP